MPGSARREGWEVCGSEATQPWVQAGITSKTQGAVGEVGVLHSIVDLWALDADYREQLRQSARREGTCSDACKRSKNREMARQGYKLLKKFGSSNWRSIAAMRLNRPGEPDTGNPYVRFDEGRSGNAVLTTTVGSIRLSPLRLLY
jgi:hypothetical protein